MDERTRLTSATLGRPKSRRSVNPVVERGSTVLMERAERLYAPDAGVTYGTEGLSTQQALRAAIADLEHAHTSFLVPSGLAGITVALGAVLKAGDDVLVTDAIYNPTRRFLARQMARFGVTARYFRPDAEVDEIMALASDKTRLIVLETPGSLTFEMLDIPAIAAAAKARGILTFIDSTWAAGVLFKPLDHGVDISMQALTKYVAGHSDVLMGSISVKDPALARTIADAIQDWGWCTAADEAWLALRGLRSMHVRLERSGASGLKVANWLATRDEVAEVLHPARFDHPQHDIYQRDFTGCAGLFTVVMQGGDGAACEAMLDAMRLFGIGYSWGGYESLAIWEGPQRDGRQFRTDYAGPLVRLYVGLENPDDLIFDLTAGLEAFVKVRDRVPAEA